MDIKRLRIPSLMISLIVVILACNIPTSEGLEASALPTATEEPASPPTEAPIQHQVIPASLPADRSSHAGDYDSSTTAAIKQAGGGDRFTFGRFERPFNANTMDVYFPNLDIVDTFVFQDDTWIYGTIQMKGRDGDQALPNKYALELDLDLDGKGDWLILASSPASTDWSVEGMQVYEDTNNDVGNESAMYTDEGASGDGFESMVFDQGIGDDPDTAWVRISPADPNTVEISVKLSVLGNPEKYLINMWAGNSLLDPALFDINDRFTHEQAGAADPGFEIFYPIKDVAEIDNSCRMAVGFEPTGQEPGLCEVFIPVVPGEQLGCQLSDSICESNGPGWYFDEPNCQCNYFG
jgi:hypothetical protein